MPGPPELSAGPRCPKFSGPHGARKIKHKCKKNKQKKTAKMNCEQIVLLLLLLGSKFLVKCQSDVKAIKDTCYCYETGTTSMKH